MRQIGFIDEERDAARFGDYLLTQGIVSSIEEMSGGAWAVWIEDENHLDRARAELDQFRANPSDPRYEATGKAEKIRKSTEKAERRRRQQHIDVRTTWSQPGQLARPVTVVLAVFCIIASLAGTKLNLVQEPVNNVENALLIAPITPTDGDFVTWDGLSAIRHGQVWRLVTPIFLHYGILHLLFNLFILFDLASMIESRRGTWRFLGLVLATAVLSNIAEYYASFSLTEASFRESPMFGGMSGVNYALFGYAWMKGKYQPHLGVGVAPQTVTVMLFWLVLCFTGLVGSIANVAHVVGLLCGVVIAYVPYEFQRLRRAAR